MYYTSGLEVTLQASDFNCFFTLCVKVYSKIVYIDTLYMVFTV